jgi:hypothetical protein
MNPPERRLGSDAAQALNYKRGSNHRQDGCHELPMVSKGPVVQPSQCRMGLRGCKQIADENDLFDRKHGNHECDGSADLRSDYGS